MVKKNSAILKLISSQKIWNKITIFLFSTKRKFKQMIWQIFIKNRIFRFSLRHEAKGLDAPGNFGAKIQIPQEAKGRDATGN